MDLNRPAPGPRAEQSPAERLGGVLAPALAPTGAGPRPPLPPLLRAASPAVVHLLGQLVAVLAVQLLARHRDRPFLSWATSWDGERLLAIATRGYGGAGAPPDLAAGSSDLAFFPGYPALVGLVHDASGAGVSTAGLLVSAVAGCLAAQGLVVLVREALGWPLRRGLVLVALVSTGPLAVVLTMTYTEALFTAGAVWTLVLVVRQRWWPAAAACALTGLVRPTGVALVVALAVALVPELLARRAGPGAAASLLLAPLGTATYLGWVALRTGDPRGWSAIQQEGWGTRVDGGAFTARQVATAVLDAPAVLDVVTTVVLAAAVVALVRCVRHRLPWPLVAYAAVVVAQDLGTAGVWNSKVRLLLTAAPVLLVPLAGDLARRPPAVRAGWLVTWALLGSWYGAYALVVYGYAV